MVTLKDIAERLNVSIPLVSKVLNNSRSTVGVSESTAEKIRKVAGEMGYVRNRSAVALRKGRHDSIGVMVQTLGAPGYNYTEQMLTQISKVALQNAQQMQLGFYHSDEEFLQCMARMNRAAVDGIIVSGAARESLRGYLRDFNATGMPMVSISVFPISEGIPNVGCSEQKLCSMGVEHLIEQGCRRIAHLKVKMLRGRYEGYCQGLERRGIALDPALVVEIADDPANNEHVSMAAGVRAVRELLRRGVEFDAISCQCDCHALAAMRVLTEAGISVPEQVKLVGVDNAPVCELGQVPLTSVDGMVSDRARAAAEMILRARKGEKPHSIMIEPILYPRRSTAV